MKRNLDRERELVSVAAQSIGHAQVREGRVEVSPLVEALNRLADERAWPGDVEVAGRKTPLLAEAAEELADLRSYLVWHAQAHYDATLAGDGDAADEYGRAMRALALTLEAWAALAGH